MIITNAVSAAHGKLPTQTMRGNTTNHEITEDERSRQELYYKGVIING